MKKKFCIFSFLFIAGFISINAQDLIVLRNGNIIESVVVEISPAEIRYKRFDHQDGPTIVLPVADVLSIRYQNGRVEIFDSSSGTHTRQPPAYHTEQPQATPPSQENPYIAIAQEIAVMIGVPSSIQEIINGLPAIRIAGRNLKFIFMGETWTANANGRPFSSGTVTTSAIEGGYLLTLSQTHTYLRGQQIDTPDLTIHLEFKPGPPVIFRVLTGSELPEGIAQTGNAEERVITKERYSSIGLSIGTAFVTPAFIGTVHGTVSPYKNFYFELGLDWGLVYTGNYYEYVDGYYSLYPYLNVGFFFPFKNKGGWYIGIGFGYMYSNYTIFEIYEESFHNLAINIFTGINLFNWLDISYTLRTNFVGASNKLSIGYVYRFK